MKKKIFKLFTIALTLCLTVGVLLGISAFAEESEGTEDTPYIMSKNVSYESKIYVYYAVPKNSIPAGESFKLVGEDKYGEFEITKYIDDVVFGVPCYIFKSRGVPAKELNNVETVKVVTDTKESAPVSYSVEQYLYEKLYDEGYSAMTEADGADYNRRKLYFKLLEYGATAQELLVENAEDLIGDSSYVYVEGATEATRVGHLYESAEIKLVGALSEKGEKVSYWNLLISDYFGKETVVTKKVEDGYEFTIGRNCISATPVYEDWGAEDVEMLNKMTFVDGTIGAATVSLGNGASYEIADSMTGTDGVTKENVLKINNVRNSGVTFRAATSEYIPNSDTIYWEIDLLPTCAPIEMQFGDVAKGKAGLIYFNSSDGKLTLAGLGGSGKTNVTMNYNEWNHLSLEYSVRYDEALGYDVFECKITANGVSHTFTGEATVELSSITSIPFYMGYDAASPYYIDNARLALPSYPVIDFNGTPADSLVTVSGVQREIVDSFTDSQGVTHENVLHVNKTEKGAVSIKVNITDGDKLGANAIVFEADVWASNSGAFAETNYGGKLAWDNGYGYTNNKWMKLKLIYKQEADGTWKSYAYLNGSANATGKYALTLDISEISYITLKGWNGTLFEYYIDNIKFYRAYVP